MCSNRKSGQIILLGEGRSFKERLWVGLPWDDLSLDCKDLANKVINVRSAKLYNDSKSTNDTEK